MKREIKFRAWDKINNQWIYASVLDIGKYKDLIDPEKVCEFTGLNDKNGIAIYEGDIVKQMIEDFSFTDDWEKEDPRWKDETLFEPMPMKEIMRDVVTMERFPRFWLKNESFGYEGDDLISEQECEVIGNIHENLELLKQ